MKRLQEIKDLRSGKINKIEALKETNFPLEFFQNLSNESVKNSVSATKSNI